MHKHAENQRKLECTHIVVFCLGPFREDLDDLTLRREMHSCCGEIAMRIPAVVCKHWT